MHTSQGKLLLVEDDEHLKRWLPEALEDQGFDVDVCGSVASAQESLRRTFDLVLLDLGLPDGDGLGLCRDLRARGDQTPIVILTARDSPEELVRGLDAGADDFVTKPFRLPELLARTRAVLRRSARADEDSRLERRGLWIDPVTRTAGQHGQDLTLKRREFDLLHFLMGSPGRTWTRRQLLDRVWGFDFAGEERTVDLHVARLRAQIEEDASRPRFIQTVWGVGYKMSEEA